MNISLLSNIVTSFSLAYIAIPPIVRLSNAKNLMDVPNQRKLNKTLVPTLGGVAIFIGAILSSMLFMPNKGGHSDIRYLFVGVFMMFFIGLKDDILVISAKKKFLVQIISSLIIVMLGHFKIDHFYGIFGISTLYSWFSIILTTVVVLFMINAINLIDGIDGLAGGIGLLASATLGAWFYMSGFWVYGTICFALAGSLIAFLRYNLWGGQNKIFMGDTGSLILGTILAAMMLKFNELNTVAPSAMYISQAPIIALALFIVPITDTLRVFTIRILQKKSPFSPDMNHIHHLLIKAGLSHIQATTLLIAYTVLFLMIGLTLQNYIDITTGFIFMMTLSFSLVGYFKKRYIQNTELEIDHSGIKTISLYNNSKNNGSNFIQNLFSKRS